MNKLNDFNKFTNLINNIIYIYSLDNNFLNLNNKISFSKINYLIYKRIRNYLIEFLRCINKKEYKNSLLILNKIKYLINKIDNNNNNLMINYLNHIVNNIKKYL